jgi:hypothetical protein
MNQTQLLKGQEISKKIATAKGAVKTAQQIRDMNNHHSLYVSTNSDGSGNKAYLSGLDDFNEKLKQILVDELETYLADLEVKFEAL